MAPRRFGRPIHTHSQTQWSADDGTTAVQEKKRPEFADVSTTSACALDWSQLMPLSARYMGEESWTHSESSARVMSAFPQRRISSALHSHCFRRHLEIKKPIKIQEVETVKGVEVAMLIEMPTSRTRGDSRGQDTPLSGDVVIGQWRLPIAWEGRDPL